MTSLGPGGALLRWQAQVVACREAGLEREDESWQRAAEWYQDWVRHNDYVDLILPRLMTVLGPTARVLEVGPGSGAFTLPLARAVQEVVAVEPSADMRAVLGRYLAQAGVGNVHLIPQQIEETVEMLAGPFDLAFASYSLYNVEEIDVVIRNLVHYAKHVVALMGSDEPREWEQDLYRRFLGRERVAPPQVQHLYPLLVEMGIYADVEILWTSYNYVYDSEEALVEWWRRRLHLPESEGSALREALWHLVERRDGQLGIYQRSRAALVWIERERNFRVGGRNAERGTDARRSEAQAVSRFPRPRLSRPGHRLSSQPVRPRPTDNGEIVGRRAVRRHREHYVDGRCCAVGHRRHACQPAAAPARLWPARVRFHLRRGVWPPSGAQAGSGVSRHRVFGSGCWGSNRDTPTWTRF